MAEALWEALVRLNGKPLPPARTRRDTPVGGRAMKEMDIDIAGFKSKSLDQFRDSEFDLVVTVCDNARESCPVFPGAKTTLHWPFDDPADATGSDDEKMVIFRRVRDEIKHMIQDYLSIGEPS